MFNRENPQNSEPQNGPRSGLDYIALPSSDVINVKKSQKNCGKYFLRGKNQFFRAKNFNVSTKTLWSVLCWLLLWLGVYKWSGNNQMVKVRFIFPIGKKWKKEFDLEKLSGFIKLTFAIWGSIEQDKDQGRLTDRMDNKRCLAST